MSSLRRIAQDLNAFVRLADLLTSKHDARAGPLSACKIAVKDNICTLDHPTTCASKGLKSYESPFEATVISLLRDAGASFVGKTNLDEFGMGSHSVHSSHGAIKNASDPAKSAGGSSGGSAVAVATNQCNLAIGTDTGGSVRLPAAYNGVIGFKPSYGLISRWGIVPYANSLDTVGYLAKTVEEIRQAFRVTNRHDAADPTSLPPKSRDRLHALRQEKKTGSRRLVVGVPTDYNIASLEPQIRSAWISALQRLQNIGHTLSPVSLQSTRRALPAYYILAPAEASSNLAKYDGVQYGENRERSFGPEVRRRILLGAYSLSASAMDNYFLQAQKMRRLVVQDFNGTFSLPNILFPSPQKGNVDIILCPTAPTAPPLLDDILKEQTDPTRAYMNDVFTVPASLAGLPALSVPFHGVGMQVIGQYGDDELILDFGENLITHST